MVLESPVTIFIVHSNYTFHRSERTGQRIPIEATHADFDRSILEQIDDRYDLLVLEWELETPSARGIVDMVRQSAPDTQILALAADVPEEDPIDRGADEFLVQPVTAETLDRTIERLALQQAYDAAIDDCYRLATERALLQSELASDADVGEQYLAVTESLQECRERAAAIRDAFASDEFDLALRQLLDE